VDGIGLDKPELRDGLGEARQLEERDRVRAELREIEESRECI